MIANQTKQNPKNRTSIRRRRMFDSPESAALWFDIFNGFLFVGALLVTVGTWGTIKTAGIKEKFSDERIAANEAETKRSIADSDAAKEGTAKANERIAELSNQGDQLRKDTAEANRKAEEERLARVKIEERIAWRKLDAGQANQILSVAKQFSGQEYALTVSADPEAMNLMGIVDEVLQAAEWVRVKPFGIITTFADRASVGMKTGPLGFHIAVSKGDSPLKGVAIRMAQIFEAVGIKSEPALDPEIEKRPTAINVVIASKPF